MTDSFPRQHARTQRFTLGEPRNVTVSPDGQRIVFLRSSAGDDPINSLWTFDVATREEHLLADARSLQRDGDGESTLTDEERARRERMRDGSSGITGYATDAEFRIAAFALDGALFVADIAGDEVHVVDVPGPVHDPRPDPTARQIAYASAGSIRLSDVDGTPSKLIEPESPTISWGIADFVAAEEMHRFRGFWWSPDGHHLAACRVDEAPVTEWTIADPASPGTPARTVRYPAAGTANPHVTLHVLGLDGSRVDAKWDTEAFPYLATVDWTRNGLLVSLQSRDQRTTSVRVIDPSTGTTRVLADVTDEHWVENVPGLPRLLGPESVLTAREDSGVRRLFVGDSPITPPHVQVRAVVATIPDAIVFHGNDIDEPTQQHVYSVRGAHCSPSTSLPGVHTATVAGSTTVIRSATLDSPGATHTVLVGLDEAATLATHAEAPCITTAPVLLRTGSRELATAVVLPSGRSPDDDTPIPVLLDPYGGPHAQRVVGSYNAYLTSQWFADQGYAVVIADGRGTPGRGSQWERAVAGDLADPPLNDQVDALHGAAERFPALDLTRVAIRGWSFGGYLAALAVLRRPDVFHAAIAGAPVTEWRMYDTHYTERYLGDPGTDTGRELYDRNSLLPLAAELTRPLLLVHGLADDNVVAAHTLQLSSALLAAGRFHEVLPLVGVTHMTPQEVVAENLLRHQLSFLSRALGSDLESSDS